MSDETEFDAIDEKIEAAKAEEKAAIEKEAEHDVDPETDEKDQAVEKAEVAKNIKAKVAAVEKAEAAKTDEKKPKTRKPRAKPVSEPAVSGHSVRQLRQALKRPA